jgi:hypothetical protein
MAYAPRPTRQGGSGTASRKSFESSTRPQAREATPLSKGRVRALSDWLGEEDDFRSLAAQASRLLTIAQALKALHPQHPVTVLGLDKGTLQLGGRNAAEAARIRQIEPRLVAQLRQQGIAVERLRVRSRPSQSANTASSRGGLARTRQAIPDAALAELDVVKLRLRPGRLSDALATLIGRQRRQRR